MVLDTFEHFLNGYWVGIAVFFFWYGNNPLLYRLQNIQVLVCVLMSA